ncbi:hypothetical protein BBBOND_0105500 [Babesia bigemina]|uniref:Uncharacterized protein n=1 Tax=Babesia bigemina TaxID=5866 RepID=A0A061D084_BABBI|nr:hypothetical protein BBBOND_0105500 [Babesia bigemina]CDR94241.1 hypothetical protein BBBOND_0105500 [Babesia bigemina]|eukprot:XP_012766427.1 hypothetical protein BBBOND_0105500 [Babesia bigemina]
MVEIYINRQRSEELELQLTADWNLNLPKDLSLCEDISKTIERAISKLRESNTYMRSVSESGEDVELEKYIKENEMVIRRKIYQLNQVKTHMDKLRPDMDKAENV